MIIVETDIYGGQDGYSSLWLYLFETCPLSNPRRCRSILDVLLRTFLWWLSRGQGAKGPRSKGPRARPWEMHHIAPAATLQRGKPVVSPSVVCTGKKWEKHTRTTAQIIMISFRTCESGGSVKWRSGGKQHDYVLWSKRLNLEGALLIPGFIGDWLSPSKRQSILPARIPTSTSIRQPKWTTQTIRPCQTFYPIMPHLCWLFVPTSIGPTLIAWLRSNWVVLSPWFLSKSQRLSLILWDSKKLWNQPTSKVVHVLFMFFRAFSIQNLATAMDDLRRNRRAEPFWMAWLVWLNPRVETMGFYPQVWRNHDGYR